MRHRVAYGLNLAIKARVLRAVMGGMEPDAGVILRELVGRWPQGELADLERRVVKNIGANVLADSPLDESELAAFYGDLAVASAFDALLAGGANVVPLRTRLGIVSQAATGHTPAEATTKTVTRLEFDPGDVEPALAMALVVLSQEFAELGLVATAETIEREVVKAAAVAADALLVAAITAGTPGTTASSGNFAEDLRAAFAVMPANAGARYFALVAPATCRQLATIDDGQGTLLFPDIDASRGGSAGGAARVVPCSALETSATVGPDLLVLDATQLALAASRMAVALSRHAALDMRDTPSGAAQLVSLWQTNALGIRAERSISATLLREEALFVVTGADYSEAVA